MHLCLYGYGDAQDALAQHFRGHESTYNPAFTGQVGATRVTAGTRSQWGATSRGGTAAVPGYKSYVVNYEEGLPCLFFDYGLFARQNSQGHGQLVTSEFGGRVAVAIPLTQSGATDRVTNLRFGLGMSRGQRRIDYNGLVFLDQLHDVTGLIDWNGDPNTSSFVPAGPGQSPWYTSTSLGASIKGGILNRQHRTGERPITYDIGVAVHNWKGLVSQDGRQTASLNGNDTALRERWVVSGNASLVVAKRNRRYWSVHPLVVAQRQGRFAYAEVGGGLSWNRNFELGLYQHLATTGEAGTNWTTVRTDVGTVLPDGYTRVDLGLGWSFQYGSLKNHVRAPFELTATFSFGKSISCLATGGNYDFVSSRKQSCYSFGTARNRIYDNIWYQN
nr:type IX secretion system membrane protein PorP/SprF [Lewinella sp. JB7]